MINPGTLHPHPINWAANSRFVYSLFFFHHGSVDELTLPALEGRGFLIQRDDLFNQAGARKNRGLLGDETLE
ncbi:MAG: hypothetical protein F6K53_40325 [Moorea sp. SIO4A1]|uniref:hypothetical protein n=1 Tax=Moorena sp. SIO4A1 TaxID=2607835 RepID=UPI00144BC8BE|nr:hypothetical protein [Moorena sp. SIO4A1]NEQ63256.1 hypothetical protein [Moorena sp. SIO4A1]